MFFDSQSFASNLWKEIKSLSLNDTELYIIEAKLEREPGIKLVSIAANPRKYNRRALHAILLLHRFSFYLSNQDIINASFIIEEAVSLVEDPEYAFFFFLLAAHFLDLFERTTELSHLSRAVDLLYQLFDVQKQGTSSHLIIAAALMSACIQFSLKADEPQARESATQILEETRQSYTINDWTSSFGNTRTLVIIGDAVRRRIQVFGPDEEFEKLVPSIRALLDDLREPVDQQYSALQILIVSVVLLLSQTEELNSCSTSLKALHLALQPRNKSSLLSSQQFTRSELTVSDTVATLSRILDQCSVFSGNQAMCLIYIAEILERQRPSLNMAEYHDYNFGALDETVSLWTREWEAACLFLRGRIQSLQLDIMLDDIHIGQQRSLFRIQALVAHRKEASNERFRQADHPGTHICIFKFVKIPEESKQKLEANPQITHSMFFRHLQRLCEDLSSNEVEELIEDPDKLDLFFGKSRYLKGNEEPLASWKESAGVLAYLFSQKSPKRFENKIKAAQHLFSVNLGDEPAYSHFTYQIAADLIYRESNIEAVGMASHLFTEFLRVQRPGSPKHYLAILDLAFTFATDFLNHSRRLPLLALALEMFREALTLRGSRPWILEARKTVILGRILRHRFKTLEDSDEMLEQVISSFNVLWDLLPLARPFSASTLEVIVTTTLIYLARSELDINRWMDVIRLLHAGLDLYINGSAYGSTSPSLCIQNIDTASRDLLEGGLLISYFSMASEALCLLHMSDMLRSVALDCCEHPQSLPVSAEVYGRDLELCSKSNPAHYVTQRDSLRTCWDIERRGLEGIIRALIRQTCHPSESSTIIEAARLSIFRYRAGTSTQSNAPSSFQHSCILVYHPTRVSFLPRMEWIPVDTFAPSSPSDSLSDYPQWPGDFMPLSNESEPRIALPSTIIPGIEQVINDESHEHFELPLEPRTIKAIMHNIDHDVRGTEAQASNISERLIYQETEAVYWNYKDIQLNTRIEKLKTHAPFLTSIGPLQALLSRGPEKCLELVESSRSLFWTRLLRLKTSFTGLPDDLAQRLETVTLELESCQSQSVASASREELQRQWELEAVFRSLLFRARGIPGFESFLKPKTHDKLLEASAHGPVVVLLGGNSTYAALVVRPQGVDSVLLEELTDQILQNLIVGLNDASSKAKADSKDMRVDRKAKKAKPVSYVSLLDQLWKLIVDPIFRFMGYTPTTPNKTNKRLRLWWCPTGNFTFLPLHAARSKSKVHDNVFTHVISSYTPTLSALISARQSLKEAQAARSWRTSDLKTLVLAQPKSERFPDLPSTLHEVETIESIIPSNLLLHVSPLADIPLLKSNTKTTVEDATAQINDGVAILHLACHGYQDQKDPLNSGFELEDGRLTLAKLISCRTPNAFLAFLSACESASNDMEIPDESLNLAAAMLYAGFRSVIGTMWRMNDGDGPEITRAIYEALFKEPHRVFDPSVVPEALDHALQKFQKAGIPPSRWATYIHVGI